MESEFFSKTHSIVQPVHSIPLTSFDNNDSTRWQNALIRPDNKITFTPVAAPPGLRVAIIPISDSQALWPVHQVKLNAGNAG